MSFSEDKFGVKAHRHGYTDTQTDAGNDNTRRPQLSSGKNSLRNPFSHIEAQNKTAAILQTTF